MTEKHKTNDQGVETTMRVAGSVPVVRLQEILKSEPTIKFEIVAPHSTALRK